MHNQSALDLYYMLQELDLQGAKIDQVYQYEQKFFVIRLHKSGQGKKELAICLPDALFLTEFRPSAPQATSFCLYLRKKLSGSFVDSVTQLGFDRRILFTCKRFDSYMYLILELFDKGNLILCSKNEKGDFIIESAAQQQVWSDRTIKKGEVYAFEPRPFAHELTKERFEELVFENNTEQLDENTKQRAIASKLGLGGWYAKLVEPTYEGVCSLFTKQLSPHLHGSRVVPFAIDSTSQPLESMSAGFDQQFEKEQAQEQKPKEHPQLKKLRAIIQAQTKQQEQLEKTIEQSTQIGEYIYANFETVQEILQSAKLKKKHPLIKKQDGFTVQVQTESE
ncbi:MAG: NFACT family protein [Candidatus Woesearchaeota archaeon]